MKKTIKIMKIKWKLKILKVRKKKDCKIKLQKLKKMKNNKMMLEISLILIWNDDAIFQIIFIFFY